MTATLSKRHQARNERALQDLIKTVPGNDRCADCGARNPGWASWSLGIFLCMRCASLHRKLGTHISKVKSLSMDSWSNEQVDSMKRNGNVNTNRTFNPQNTKPPIPLDVDEVDAVLERFIRQKYDHQSFSSGRSRPAVRNDTGSTRSSEGEPPPLPPKPGKRFGFGFRSASSNLPLQRSLPATPPLSPTGTSSSGRGPSPIRVNKQSRVFGASVGGGGDEIEAKLVQLRDMGFHDERRNVEVLRGLGGNLERSIECLVRLGEGSGPASRTRTPNPPRNIAFDQPLPPLPSDGPTGAVNGISFATNGSLSQSNTGNQTSLPRQDVSPPKVQPTRNFTSPNPFQSSSQSYNPFDTPSQQSANPSLEASLHNLQLSQPPQQPLFPNATGGYPSQPQPQESRFQTMTPPVPLVPQQYMQSTSYSQQSPIYNGNSNPFYQNTHQQTFAPTNPYASNIQPQINHISQNPYQQMTTSQTYSNGYSTEAPQPTSPQIPQPFQQQSVSQQQQQPFASQPMQFSNPPAPPHSYIDPAQNSIYAQPQRTQSYNQFQSPIPPPSQQFQPQPLQPQPTGRIDKSSILSLYNYPQLAPPPLPNNPAPLASNEQPGPDLPSGIKPAQRSVTMPLQLTSGSKNPFQPASINPNMVNGNPPGTYRHASQESVDVGGYQNGRHSPDAFASLSASFVR